jgi:hypothetical protein
MFSFNEKVDKRGINRITYQKGRYCQKLWDILLPHFKHNNVLELLGKAGQKHKQSRPWNESTWGWNLIVQIINSGIGPMFFCLTSELKPEVYLSSSNVTCVTGALVSCLLKLCLSQVLNEAIFWPVAFSHQKQEFVWRMRIPEGYLRFNNLCYWP